MVIRSSARRPETVSVPAGKIAFPVHESDVAVEEDGARRNVGVVQGDRRRQTAQGRRLDRRGDVDDDRLAGIFEEE